jgi:hypothetical protein
MCENCRLLSVRLAGAIHKQARLERKLQIAEQDYDDIVNANYRIIMHLRQIGVAVPGHSELKERYGNALELKQ